MRDRNQAIGMGASRRRLRKGHEVPGDLERRILAWRPDNKIPAIKEYRDQTGACLKDAKRAVEDIWDRYELKQGGAVEVYDVVKKLIGPIESVGDSGVDGRRYENLQEHIKLVDALMVDLSVAALGALRHEASMRKIGLSAREALNEMRESIDTDY